MENNRDLYIDSVDGTKHMASRYPFQMDMLVRFREAFLTEAAFVKLGDYSHTLPTGPYAGMVWKTFDSSNKIWYLCWYNQDRNDPNMLKGNYLLISDVRLPNMHNVRELFIKTVEMFDKNLIEKEKLASLQEMLVSKDEETIYVAKEIIIGLREDFLMECAINRLYMIRVEDGDWTEAFFEKVDHPENPRCSYNAFVPIHSSDPYEHFLMEDTVQWIAARNFKQKNEDENAQMV